nr:glycosyltransferase [Actinomycetota bacterium]
MPRVLQLFEPPDGGVAQQVLNLSTALAARGWEVEVAGPEEAVVYPELERAGIRPHRLPLRRDYGRPDVDAVALGRAIPLLRRRRPDLLHCHSTKAGVVGRLAAGVVGCPTLYSPHCWPFVGDLGVARRLFSWAAERALGPLTAAFVCVCEDERQRAIEAGVDSGARLWRVYNGCPPCPEGVEVDAELLALRSGGPLAAAVTVLREQKGLHTLLEAAPRVFAALPEARIAIVGDGPLAGPLRARAGELGLDGDERFAFLAFDGPSSRHLRALDAYVLPSSWEAFPIGVLEALACGIPQVATDVGGTSEAVDDETGVLVPPREPAALADALVALLSDDEHRRAMATASRARHRRWFTLDRMVTDTERVYAWVLGLDSRAGGSA